MADETHRDGDEHEAGREPDAESDPGAAGDQPSHSRSRLQAEEPGGEPEPATQPGAAPQGPPPHGMPPTQPPQPGAAPQGPPPGHSPGQPPGPPPQGFPPPQQHSPGGPPPGHPPPAHPPPGGQGPRQSASPVVVPSWVSSDWLAALQIAGVGQILLLLGAAAISLVLLFAAMSAQGIDTIDWSAAAASPLATLLGWAGGGDGTPLLVTGVLYTFIAYRLTLRWTPTDLPAMLSSAPRGLAAAGKIGVLAAGILLAVGILLNSFAENALAGAFGVWVAAQLDLTSLVFFSLFISALTGLFAMLSAARMSFIGLLGIRTTTPQPVRLGMAGARRTVLAGGAGLLLLHTLGTLLDDLTRAGTSLGDVGDILLTTVGSLVTTWLDTAMLLILGTTKFLHDGGFIWSSGAIEGWMWLGIPVLVAAYLAGGIKAAKDAAPATQAHAAKAALLVGPFVAAVGLLVAAGWAGQPFIDDIAPIAILLPTLWGVVAVAGAWLWANQQGLGSGLVLQQEQSQQAPVQGGWPPPQPDQGIATSAPPTAETDGQHGETPSPAGAPPDEAAAFACPTCGQQSQGRFCGACGTQLRV